MTPSRWSTTAGASLAGLALLAASAAAQDKAEILYRITYADTPAPGHWDIEVEGRGLGRARDVFLHLQNWGEWRDVAADYVTELTAEPPLRRGAGRDERFEFDKKGTWRGAFRVSYRIPLRVHGSDAYRAHGLLPWRLGELASGFAHNTLPRVLRGDGETIEAARTVELVAPDGVSIATGWRGLAVGRQKVALQGDIDQCLVMFGVDPFVTKVERDGRTHEVIQFGPADITPPIAELTGRIVAAGEATFGRKLPRPARVFITGEDPGGGGGVRTDWGIGLGYSENASSPYYRQTLAHELFHDWLPGVLGADGPKVVWFHEGFTDYMSLWLAAKTGVVEREWFAQRILEIDRDARRSSAFGVTSYADPTVDWRDGDGPLETLAYKGGALLAFHIDVQLRKRKKGSTASLLRDLMDDPGSYSLRTLRRALGARGLGSFYERHIVKGAPIPDTRAALESVGFYRLDGEIDAHLTWFGIKTDQGIEPGRILDIRQDGPKAQQALQVGDRIIDYGPNRAGEVRVKPDYKPEHAFGLTLFDTSPGPDRWWVEVVRKRKKLRIEVEPWLQANRGIETTKVADPKRIATFFDDGRPSRR